MAVTPPVPTDLGSAGAEFWRSTLDRYVLDSREILLLLEVCRTLDEIGALVAVVKTEGPMGTGAKGQPREHAALGALRAHRLTLCRLLTQLALPGADGVPLPSPASTHAKRAAETRWARVKRAEAG